MGACRLRAASVSELESLHWARYVSLKALADLLKRGSKFANSPTAVRGHPRRERGGLKLFARSGSVWCDDVVERQMPLIQGVVSSGEPDRTAAIFRKKDLPEVRRRKVLLGFRLVLNALKPFHSLRSWRLILLAGGQIGSRYALFRSQPDCRGRAGADFRSQSRPQRRSRCQMLGYDGGVRLADY